MLVFKRTLLPCLWNIFIYFFISLRISLFISISRMLGVSIKPATTIMPPPALVLLIPLQKIKPLSNKLMYSLIQSSHHHRVLASSALVTTAGLLSLAAMATALLVASMIYHKKGEKKERRERKKRRASRLSHWHLWLTRPNQLIWVLIKMMACRETLYLTLRELWAPGAGPDPLCLSKHCWNQSLMSRFHFASSIRCHGGCCVFKGHLSAPDGQRVCHLICLYRHKRALG